jgi:hypothetical protein
MTDEHVTRMRMLNGEAPCNHSTRISGPRVWAYNPLLPRPVQQPAEFEPDEADHLRLRSLGVLWNADEQSTTTLTT